jgi:anti-sigma B factor antagonist
MPLKETQTDELKIITVNLPRIDAAVAIQFKDAMREATETGSDHIVLDLSNVNFVDSSGLGAIVASKKQLPNGKKIDLAGLTPDVAKVFRLTRMDSVFKIYAHVSDLARRAAG